ncbi:hypothetical protein LTS18_007334 [Coniosporium uncinatum]|uniref:Uncharacterized protein n=1 Tax=Coniosporium uncinatum TaxID=93489 RepID=A0ACC3D2Q0_9PEZI|nr:hypothetical protein LTS18_007334 [Coniosporium uncinatum]
MIIIPLPYRIIFIVLDILLPAFGIYSNILSPSSALAMFTPFPTLPPAPETQVLLDSSAGFFAMLLTLNVAFLAYRPNDILVWKTLQAGTLMTDVFMLLGFAKEMQATGRFNTGMWTGQDWGNVSGYAAIAAVRVAFLMEVGKGRGQRKGKGKET